MRASVAERELGDVVGRRLSSDDRWSVGAACCVAVFAAPFAGNGWGSSGVRWLGVGVVAFVAVAAAVHDRRARRIPNCLVVAGAGVVVAAATGAVALGGDLGRVATDVGLGVLLGGAPLLFVTWLIAPAAIGGGDWKLLTVLGAGIGLLDPFAAPAIVLVACVVAATFAALRRQRSVAFAPPLLAGYLAACAVALVWRATAATPPAGVLLGAAASAAVGA